MKRKLTNRRGGTGGGRHPFSWVPGESVIREKAKCADETLFISSKRTKESFVLVRTLGPACFTVIRFLAIEGQLLQLSLRYFYNKWERNSIQRERKLRLEGLFVELEPVSFSIFRPYEQLALQYLFLKVVQEAGKLPFGK